jgi:hypothetical protein
MGESQPVTAVAAGETFTIKEPFEFSIAPEDLPDEEG